MADQVARFAPPRIPYLPAVQDRFGVDQAGWRALIDAVWPAARTAEAVVLALSYCKARKLDPFKRPVHIVPIYSRELKRMVESVWPGIGELRTTAFRTGLYAGREATEWGPDRELSFDSTSIVYPEWAQVTVHRLDKHGNSRAYPGPRVHWLESYATVGRETVAPNEMWRRRTRGQLDKCAEAAALRAAFPEELGNDYSAEEMEGQVIDHAPPPPDVDEPKAPRTTGNRALRDKLARRLAPEEPTEAEIEVRGILKEDPAPPPDSPREDGDVADDVPPSPSEGDTTIPMILPARLKRGWDWPGYATELIEAAHRLPPEQVGKFRALNASQINNLRISHKEEWSRVQQALADHEREGEVTDG